VSLGKIQLCRTLNIGHPYFASCKEDFDVELCNQHWNDLGERMDFAISDCLKKYQSVLLIGCDCPTLMIDDLNIAWDKLQGDYDVIFCPAKDRGYYLIGMEKPILELFSDM